MLRNKKMQQDGTRRGAGERDMGMRKVCRWCRHWDADEYCGDEPMWGGCELTNASYDGENYVGDDMGDPKAAYATGVPPAGEVRFAAKLRCRADFGCVRFRKGVRE